MGLPDDKIRNPEKNLHGICAQFGLSCKMLLNLSVDCTVCKHSDIQNMRVYYSSVTYAMNIVPRYFLTPYPVSSFCFTVIDHISYCCLWGAKKAPVREGDAISFFVF